MENVTLITEASLSNYDRRIENLSKKDTVKAFVCFLVTLLFIRIISSKGPPYVVPNMEDLALSAVDSSKRVFRFNLDSLGRLNKFLIFEVNFERNFQDSSTSTEVLYNVQTHSYLGTDLINDLHHASNPIQLNFLPGTNVTETLRLYSSPKVNFDHFKIITYLEFLDKKPLTTHFSFFTADSAFTILCIIIRCVLFVIGIFAFVFFVSLNMKLGSSSISNQFIYILLATEILATNPFVILDCFVESPIFGLTDAFCTQLFFVVTCYCSFVHLLYKDRKNESPSKTLLISLALPFLVAFCLMFANSLYSVIITATDPIIKKTGAWHGLFYTQFVLLIVFIALTLFAGYFPLSKAFSSLDQHIHTIMALFFAVAVCLTQYKAPHEQYVGTSYAMQIYSTAATAAYAFFFTYFNWPVEPIPQLDENQDVVIDDLDSSLIDNGNLKDAAISPENSPMKEQLEISPQDMN